jgi:hypothetical protein
VIIAIEKNAVGANSKDARQFVRDYDYGGAQTVSQIQNQLIKQTRDIGSRSADGSPNNSN